MDVCCSAVAMRRTQQERLARVARRSEDCALTLGVIENRLFGPGGASFASGHRSAISVTGAGVVCFPADVNREPVDQTTQKGRNQDRPEERN